MQELLYLLQSSFFLWRKRTHEKECRDGERVLSQHWAEVIPSENLVVVRIGPAPHENLNAWTNQQVMDLLPTDETQIVQNSILERPRIRAKYN
jgi:hypothetical protein